MTYEPRDGNRSNFRNDRNDRNDRSDFKDDGKMQLFIAKGRNHGMDEGSLIEFVASETGVNPQAIARIKILDDFSFFAADNEDAETILEFFRQKAGDEGRPLVSKAKRKKPSEGGDRNGGGFRGERRGFGGGNNDRNGGGGNRFGGRSDNRGGRDDRNSDRPRRDFRD